METRDEDANIYNSRQRNALVMIAMMREKEKSEEQSDERKLGRSSTTTGRYQR